MVFKYLTTSYNTTYKTEQQLFVRVKEHTMPTSFPVFSHIKQCKFCQSYDNVLNSFDVIKFCKKRNT